MEERFLLCSRKLKENTFEFSFASTFLLLLLLLCLFTLFPPAFHEVPFFFFLHIPTRWSRPLCCTQTRTRVDTHAGKIKKQPFQQKAASVFQHAASSRGTAEQKNRTETKAERTLPSFHARPSSCLPLKACCLFICLPSPQFSFLVLLLGHIQCNDQTYKQVRFKQVQSK